MVINLLEISNPSFFLFRVQNSVLETFYIDEQTGKIFLIAALDYEMIPQYRLIIRATDLQGTTVSTQKYILNISVLYLRKYTNDTESFAKRFM